MKQLLFFLLLVIPSIALAIQVPTNINITTGNDTVTLKDDVGTTSTYACSAPQAFQFQGKAAYDIKATDCRDTLTNVSCNVPKDLQCQIAQGQVDSIRNDCIATTNKVENLTVVTNGLPSGIVTSLGIVKALQDNLTMCSRNEAYYQTQADGYKGQKDIFSWIAGALVVITVLLLAEDKFDLFSRLRRKDFP